jgi:hypothetical protein
MSELNTSMHVRVNKAKREKFDRIARSQYGMKGPELIRMLMDAVNDNSLRIVITEKTKATIIGVHIHA